MPPTRVPGGCNQRQTVCRYWCTEKIAAEPSPTAAATRRLAPARTSPAAKTPGTLVSNINGSRSSAHRASRAAGRAGHDEAFVVQVGKSRQHLGPRRHADEDEQGRRVERFRESRVDVAHSMRSRCALPHAAVTSTFVITVMFFAD